MIKIKLWNTKKNKDIYFVIDHIQYFFYIGIWFTSKKTESSHLKKIIFKKLTRKKLVQNRPLSYYLNKE